MEPRFSFSGTSASFDPVPRFANEDALFDEGSPYDAYEADYSVIGPTDGRFHIGASPHAPSTLLFPFNTICFVEVVDAAGGSGHGTGTLIAPQVVLTAKHVLMRVQPPCSRAHVAGKFRVRARVTPGADLSAATPQRRTPASPHSQVATSARFRAHPTLDFGVIVLPHPFTRPNRFMMLQPRSDLNTATLLTIGGYPCDKPRGTVWGHSERIPLIGLTKTHLHYTIDTCPGHSGSPIWLLGNSGIRLLLGVHTTGAPGSCANAPAGRCLPTGAPVTPVAGTNCGVRVTCEVIRTIQHWCRGFHVQPPAVDEVTFRHACTAA
jgi:glutamyl endopeptidase